MKKTRKIIPLCLILSLLISCMVHSFAISNHNQNIDMLQNERIELSAELSSEKYNHLLAAWSDNLEYPCDHDVNFPSFYGGSTTDDNGDLVIYVTRLDQDVVDYFDSLIDLDHVRFSKVTHSIQELFNTQETIDSYIRSDEGKEIGVSVTGTSVDVEENSVTVYVGIDPPANLSDVILEKFSSSANSCDINFQTLVLTFGGDASAHQIKDSKLNSSLSPYSVSGIIVEPGSPIGLEASSNLVYRRSTGFWAKNSKGELGIVTAAHGNSYMGQPVYANSTDLTKSVDFGTVTQRIFSGKVDAAFVTRGNSGFNPITYVEGWDFDLKSQTKSMKVGDTVYKKGYKTGLSMGKVLKTNFNPHSGGESELTNAILVACVADEGDSGGIVAGGGTSSSRYVAGIVSGGGYVTDGEIQIQVMYYSNASDILNSLNLKLY